MASHNYDPWYIVIIHHQVWLAYSRQEVERLSEHNKQLQALSTDLYETLLNELLKEISVEASEEHRNVASVARELFTDIITVSLSQASDYVFWICPDDCGIETICIIRFSPYGPMALFTS